MIGGGAHGSAPLTKLRKKLGLAEALHTAIAAAAPQSGSDIEVGDIIGKVNSLVENLAATGRVKLGEIRAETGDVTVRGVIAGVSPSKNL